jgi:hypothetical protein
MTTVLEECNTEEQCPVARYFCAQKYSMQRISIKNYFVFMVRSVCRVKRFTTGRRYSLKDVRKSQMMPDKVRKWMRHQSKDFYGAGFNALVTR